MPVRDACGILGSSLAIGFIQLFSLTGLVILFLMAMLWLLSLWLRDASIVDIFWGTGFVVIAWVGFIFTPDGALARKWLICGLVTVWGLRLSLHLLRRNWGRGEDFRYAAWRAESGQRWWWMSFFKVFLLQGLLLWVISAPIQAAQLSSQPQNLTPLDLLGTLIWAVGFVFEALGDWQLSQFKADPANRGLVFMGGLWRYTRHPNYFGDALQWWGFYLLALASGAGWTIFSPILMTFLLMRVSGVAMLERTLVDRKSGYREYVQSTSAYFPRLPKTRRPG